MDRCISCLLVSWLAGWLVGWQVKENGVEVLVCIDHRTQPPMAVYAVLLLSWNVYPLFTFHATECPYLSSPTESNSLRQETLTSVQTVAPNVQRQYISSGYTVAG